MNRRLTYFPFVVFATAVFATVGGCTRAELNTRMSGCQSARSSSRLVLEALWVTDESTRLADFANIESDSLAVIGQDFWPWELFDSSDPNHCLATTGCIRHPTLAESWPQAFYVGSLNPRGRLIWRQVVGGGKRWDELLVASNPMTQIVAARDSRDGRARILIRGFDTRTGNVLWETTLESQTPAKFQEDIPHVSSLAVTSTGLVVALGEFQGTIRLSGGDKSVELVGPGSFNAQYVVSISNNGTPQELKMLRGRFNMGIAAHADGRVTILSSTVNGDCTQSGRCAYMEEIGPGQDWTRLRTIPGVETGVVCSATDGGVIASVVPSEENPLSTAIKQQVVVRLDKTGSLVWSVPLPSALVATLTTADGLVFVGGSELPVSPDSLVVGTDGSRASVMASIWLLDLKSGRIRAKYSLGDGVVSKVASSGRDVLWMQIAAGAGGVDLGTPVVVRRLSKESANQGVSAATLIARVRLPAEALLPD